MRDYITMLKTLYRASSSHNDDCNDYQDQDYQDFSKKFSNMDMEIKHKKQESLLEMMRQSQPPVARQFLTDKSLGNCWAVAAIEMYINFLRILRESGFINEKDFEDTFELGEMNGGKRCRVIVFDENSMPGMVRLSEKFAKLREPYFLLARGYPESFRLPVFLRGYVLEAEVVEPPPIFDLLAKNSAILMISREYAQGFGSGKRNEAFLFIGDNQLDLAVLLRSIRATLHAEGIERYELSSPMDWLGEVKNLREYRKECQLFAGLSIGLLILVSFSSIAVFEFRQNLYVLSLFKSFGVPAFLMFLRYWTEASIIALGSFLTAIELSIRLHFPLFESLKMEIRGFEIPLAVNFKPLENDQLIIILFCSVIISMIPVAWALRVPVGKTLS